MKHATLGASILCAMMKQYPWKKHHAGFVMAHIGILTLLAGSLLSLRLGLDGNLALFEDAVLVIVAALLRRRSEEAKKRQAVPAAPTLLPAS
jgi:hypothetical protein